MARPAASSFLGWLVGGSKHLGMDCRRTGESSLGLVSRMACGVGRSRHISMARPAAAAVPGHLVVISKLCGLGRRFFHLRGPPGVPGTVFRGRFWGRDRGNNRDRSGLAVATARRRETKSSTRRRLTARGSTLRVEPDPASPHANAGSDQAFPQLLRWLGDC